MIRICPHWINHYKSFDSKTKSIEQLEICVLEANIRITTEPINIDCLAVIYRIINKHRIFRDVRFVNKLSIFKSEGKKTIPPLCWDTVVSWHGFRISFWSYFYGVQVLCTRIVIFKIYHSVTTRALQHHPETGKPIIFFLQPRQVDIYIKKQFVRFNIMRYTTLFSNDTKIIIIYVFWILHERYSCAYK